MRRRGSTLAAALVLAAALPWPAACTAPQRPPQTSPIGVTGHLGPVPRGCRGVDVRVGDDVAGVVRAHPAGTTFCLAPGTHRLAAPVRPKRGDALIGRPGAVLSGSRVVTGWRPDGAAWSARGFLPAVPGSHGECAPAEPACAELEDVFLDHRRLRRVGAAADVVPGTVHADYATNTLTIGDDPRGRLLEQAVAPSLVRSVADDVTVADLVLEEAANEAQTGAVESRQVTPEATGLRWRVVDVEVRLNHGVGVGIGGGSTISGSRIHHQGQLGVGAWGSGSAVTGNEIAFNGVAGYSSWWEAGGVKLWATTGDRLTHNDVHDNLGPGLWADGGNIDTSYENNRIADNWGPGVQHEISYDAVVRYNLVTGNGRRRGGWGWDAGIEIQSSGGIRTIEVDHNVVVGNANGITVLDSGRRDGEQPAPHGPHLVRNVSVHDNVVAVFGKQLTGALEDRGSPAIFTGGTVRFTGNTYDVDSLDADHFTWRGNDSGWAHWHGEGCDPDGVVLVRGDDPDLGKIVAEGEQAVGNPPSPGTPAS